MGIIGIDAVTIIIWQQAKNTPPTSTNGMRWWEDFFDPRTEFIFIEPPRVTVFRAAGASSEALIIASSVQVRGKYLELSTVVITRFSVQVRNEYIIRYYPRD